MELYKGSKINAIINEKGVNLGYINLNLYTMDNSTSVIDIHLKMKNVLSEKQEYFPINLNQTEFEPVLHLFAQDGSIFTNEKLEIVKAEEGYVRYYIPDYVTRHIGQVKAKLFLEDTSGSDDSSHVADFYFVVNDSGITKAVGKEIHVELLNDIVEKIMKDNLELFKGDKGDKGEPGKDGVDGKDGKDGVDGVNGSTGPQGPPGLNGVDGKSFTYEDFTPEQLENLKPKLPNFDNWQKAKLTGSDGYIEKITASVDLSEMEDPSFDNTGFYYYDNLSKAPDNRSKYGFINVYARDTNLAYAIYREYDSNVLYINFKAGSVWRGWTVLNADNSKNLNWQKFKVTNDDGTQFFDDSLTIDFTNTDQLNKLGNGTRYISKAIGLPSDVSSTSGWLTKWSRSDLAVKLIKFQPYNSLETYQKRFYKTWSDWESTSIKKPVEKPKVENLFKTFEENLTLSPTGKTATDDKNVTTDFIKISDTEKYTIGVKNIVDSKHAMYKMAFYNANKEFINLTEWSNLATNNNQTFTPPTGAVYTRIVVNAEHKNEAYLNIGVVPYYVENEKTNDGDEKVVNLLGNFKDATTLSKTTGSANPDDKNITSDFIPVSENNKYILGIKNIVDAQRTSYKLAFYDASQTFISLQDWKTFSSGNLSEIISLPANTKYVRIVINKENKEAVYFNVGEIPFFNVEDKESISEDTVQVRKLFHSERPYPNKFYWTVIDANTNIKPLDMSRDGQLIMASNGTKVSQSLDDGQTWTDVGSSINGTLIQSIRILDDGELLIGTSRDSSANVKSKLFKSKGYNPSKPSETVFNQVLEMNSPNANFNNPWCIDDYYNIILSSEYGGHYLDGARYVYLSTDYGETWTTIFDQKEISEKVTGAPTYTTDAHVHTCHYDRYRDRIWVCVGDQDNTAVYFSDDMGKTWRVIKGLTGKNVMQYTGIISYPEGVFFGSDRSPDGIYFWNPTNPETIESFYLTDRDAMRTLVYARPYRRFAKKDEVTYFVANRDDIVDGEMGPIIVALKGVLGAKTLYDFTDDMKDYVATDISSCLGETSNGNILVSVKDKNTNKYRLLRAKAPVWE